VSALNRDNPHYIDREKCTLCFGCVESCPAGALTKVGRQFEVEEILDIVKKDIPFFETSSGGVTLTGGECTQFMDFTSDLLKQLKANNIHTLIETCGHFDIDRFCKLILPFTDIIYFDIKLMDDIRHKKYCGITNKIVLQNFKELHERCRSDSIRLLPRVPLIPGITTEKGNLQGIATFLKQNGVDEAELLPYNPLWIEKAASLGMALRFEEKNWMSRDAIEECEKIFMEIGVNVYG
jgi:pyruvate formate lyase activating enzyme